MKKLNIFLLIVSSLIQQNNVLAQDLSQLKVKGYISHLKEDQYVITDLTAMARKVYWGIDSISRNVTTRITLNKQMPIGQQITTLCQLAGFSEGLAYSIKSTENQTCAITDTDSSIRLVPCGNQFLTSLTCANDLNDDIRGTSFAPGILSSSNIIHLTKDRIQIKNPKVNFQGDDRSYSIKLESDQTRTAEQVC